MRFHHVRVSGFLVTVLLTLTMTSYAQGPDTDRDGIPDGQDACPYTAARGSIPALNAYYGCVDNDFDTVADVVDSCPTIVGEAGQLQGCPPSYDRDGDGVPNDLDACPDLVARGAILGSTTYYGCADIDFDTVADEIDNCPTEAGQPELNGCGGVPDRDLDGILDTKDVCPDTFGIQSLNGCPVGSGNNSNSVPATEESIQVPAAVVSGGRTSLPTNPGMNCFVMPNHANNFVNVREAPGLTQAVLGTLDATNYYRAVGRGQEAAGGLWYKLEQGGWVAQWVVDAAGRCESLPMLPEDEPLPESTALEETNQVLPPPQPVQASAGLPQNRTFLTPANASQVSQIFGVAFDGQVIFVMNVGGLAVQSAEGIFRYDLASLQPEGAALPLEGLLLTINATQAAASTGTSESPRLVVNENAAWGLAARQAIFSPDGATLVAQSADDLSVLDFLRTDASGADAAVAYQGTIDRFLFSPDGMLIFLSHDAQNQYFLNAVNLADPTILLRSIPTGVSNTAAMTYGSDILALGTANGQLQVWDTHNWVLVNSITVWEGIAVTAVGIGADMLAVGGQAGQIVLLDLAGTPLANLSGHSGAIQQLMFSPDETLLLSASAGESILRVWGIPAAD